MIKTLRRWYFKIFKRYERIDYRCVTYLEGDRMIRATAHMAEHEQWVLAPEEDHNRIPLIVFLERRKRIME